MTSLEADTHRPARTRYLWDLLAAALVVFALRTALQATAGLEWPFDLDHLRDIAQAQTARDGSPLSDPFYAGEWVWYNPLVPWIVAIGSWVSGLAPAVFHVRGGPWLNLAGPVLFYLLAARTAGRPAGVLGLAFLLFWTSGREPVWAWATYTPWLFTADFAQALFYACGLAAIALVEAPKPRLALLAGVLTGVTFLAHSAPFVVAAAVFGTVLTRQVSAGRLRPWHAAVSAAIALAVASPFLWSIGIRYGFEVRNAAPMTWEYGPLTPQGLPQLVAAQNWPLLALAVVGLAAVSRQPAARLVVWPWLTVAAGFTVYGIVRSGHPGWPALLPTFHFWFYLTALQSLLAGIGARASIRLACRRRVALVPPLAAAAVAVLVALRVPAYLDRPDFTQLRRQAQATSADLGRAVPLVRHFTSPRDVVLARDEPGLTIAATAGRKVVSVDRFFSNPYVSHEARAAARDEMLARLAAGDGRGFASLAAVYRVTKVLATGGECRALDGAPMLRPVFASGNICVFDVRWQER